MTTEAERQYEARIVALTDELGAVGDEADAIRARIDGIAHGIDYGLKRSLEGLVFQGKSLGDVLRGLANSVVKSTYRAAISPVTKALSGAIATGIEGVIQGASPFEKGAGFTQGRVMPFATGGVVNGPTAFPMRGGTGLMGEAGPEAIMPLARGPDGRLGVRAAGGQSVNVTFNISTPDVQGFRQSQSQIAAQISRVLARAGRNR